MLPHSPPRRLALCSLAGSPSLSAVVVLGMHRGIASCLLAALAAASSLTGAAACTAILEAADDLELLEHIKEDLEPLYKLKAAMQGLTGSRSAAVEAYGGEYQRTVEKAEEIFFSVATQLGRYVITMMSSGVVLAVGFQLSGGDSQTDTLIWYSWLNGVIIGTMIGANSVLEEHCKAGPHNVVITGSTRGLGKALAREFLLSGDRVVVASRSPESVLHTINELEENIQEGFSIAKKKQRETLLQAKVVGTSCDVCKPEDVKKLVNFAVDELGSIDIWINNAGTNKGFRPLVNFSDEDITQFTSLAAS